MEQKIRLLIKQQRIESNKDNLRLRSSEQKIKRKIRNYDLCDLIRKTFFKSNLTPQKLSKWKVLGYY